MIEARYRSKYEDVEVRLEFSDLDRYRSASDSQREELTKHYQKVLSERGLTLYAIGGDGISFFPTGSRTKTSPPDPHPFVIDNHLISTLDWASVYVFLDDRTNPLDGLS